MTIGIVGSGALGSNLARALAKVGLTAIIANKRGPASLAALVEELGETISAGTVAEAASADLVVLAMPWASLKDVLGGLPAWENRIVIDGTNPVLFLEPGSPDASDPTNPLAAYGIKAVDLGDTHSSAVVSQLVAGARVVKAFNHLDVNVLPEPQAAGGQRVLFYSGDDADAKAQVRAIIEAIGFVAIDLGTLDVGGPLASLPFGALAMHNFVRI
ncbi:NAD(P)-binding domain-containing protein [Novosphingobium sp. SL115]|uniref:NADPH-dependent F420 reductase n=1 Tax=Novosphingobium sp. SL115 TaxID=2995150 RepID=UPI0022726BC0|nr:NAD(P)-binding domain-containing protein [Novosphingobium sp. SL115]MCY1669674.1 NAD(P)-binding domain-containing protein [Novosphingobium sp. SL115]